MKNKIEQMNSISRTEIERALEDLQNIIKTKVDEVDDRLRSEKRSAPEYYISDMKGFSRGMYMMGNEAIRFLRERLLGEEL